MYNRQFASIRRVVILYRKKNVILLISGICYFFVFNALKALNVNDKSIFYQINIKCNDFYLENKYDSC